MFCRFLLFLLAATVFVSGRHQYQQSIQSGNSYGTAYQPIIHKLVVEQQPVYGPIQVVPAAIYNNNGYSNSNGYSNTGSNSGFGQLGNILNSIFHG